jgi:hypothetical protein
MAWQCVQGPEKLKLCTLRNLQACISLEALEPDDVEATEIVCSHQFGSSPLPQPTSAGAPPGLEGKQDLCPGGARKMSRRVPGLTK